MTCADIRLLLPQYLDGELGASGASQCSEHLAGCESCRAQLARREALSHLVQRAPYYTASDRLRATVTARVHRRRVTPRILATAAAVLLAVSLTAVMGPRLRTPDDGRRATEAGRRTTDDGLRMSAIATEVVDEHVRALMSGRLFDVASTDQHTVKPWFLGRLDFSPPVVDLASHGFPLEGGRVDYIGGRQIAALVYTRRQHAINLFVWPSAESIAPGAETIRGFHVVHWTRGGMSLWAVSDLNEAELHQFVELQK